MKTHENASALADMLYRVGRGAGVMTRAVLTDMNQPWVVRSAMRLRSRGHRVSQGEGLDLANLRRPHRRSAC